MRKPSPSHAAWFAAGAILGVGAAAVFLASRPGPVNSTAISESVVAPLRKPNVSHPAESAAKSDPESGLRRAMASSPGLQHSRDFLTFLEGVTAGNWQATWERFAAATKGKEGLYAMDAQLLLNRIGEVAGEAGTDWFVKAGKPEQAKAVLTTWASFDPQQARAWLAAAPDAGDLGPALIKGTGLHSMESLLDFAGSSQLWAFDNYGRELIEAARLKGNPAEGEQLWRKFLKITEAEHPALAGKPKQTGVSRRMFDDLTTWQVEAAKAHGTPAAARDWLSGIIAEGYGVNEDNLSAVGYAAGGRIRKGRCNGPVEWPVIFPTATLCSSNGSPANRDSKPPSNGRKKMRWP